MINCDIVLGLPADSQCRLTAITLIKTITYSVIGIHTLKIAHMLEYNMGNKMLQTPFLYIFLTSLSILRWKELGAYLTVVTDLQYACNNEISCLYEHC